MVMVKRNLVWLLGIVAAGTGLALQVSAGSPEPLLAKDYQYGFEIEIKPIERAENQYYCLANFVDLYANRRITSPKLVVTAGGATETQIGDNGTELISLSVKVEADQKSAEVEARIQKHSFTVWRTRVKLKL